MRHLSMKHSITEMVPTPLKPIPCNRQVLDAILGAIERHRRAVASLGARKLQQRSLAWRLWGIEYDETIPIDAPEEPDWAIMATDIEAVEQEQRELTAVVELSPHCSPTSPMWSTLALHRLFVAEIARNCADGRRTRGAPCSCNAVVA